MTEQRKNQRYDLRLPCEIQRGAKPPLSGETRNMSSAGVLFTSTGLCKVGETIEYYVTFPKQPGSFYHLSKVHDSHNIQFACKIWGLPPPI